MALKMKSARRKAYEARQVALDEERDIQQQMRASTGFAIPRTEGEKLSDDVKQALLRAKTIAELDGVSQDRKSVGDINKEKFGAVFDPNTHSYSNSYDLSNIGLGALAIQEGLVSQWPAGDPPTTYTDLVHMNDKVEGSAWLFRVTRRMMQTSGGARWDVTPPSLASHEYVYFQHWMNLSQFPVVALGTDQNYYGYFVPVVYSSFKLTLDQLSHEPNYSQIQLSPLIYVWLDATYLGDENARKSVMAAMLNTWPANGSYISFLISVPFQGASCGLATSLAIMGAPPIAATGFIHSTNPKAQDDLVEHIDHMDIKSVMAIRDMTPMICPSKDVLGNGNQVFAKYWNNVYTSGMYNSGRKEWQYETQRHYLILATTLTESAVLACHIWMSGYENRPDVSLLRNKIAVDAANWQMQRRQIVDSNGGINTKNMMQAIGKPFIGAPTVDVDTSFHAGGRFLEPFPGEPLTEDQPTEPLKKGGRKPPPKKKRGR